MRKYSARPGAWGIVVYSGEEGDADADGWLGKWWSRTMMGLFYFLRRNQGFHPLPPLFFFFGGLRE